MTIKKSKGIKPHCGITRHTESTLPSTAKPNFAVVHGTGSLETTCDVEGPVKTPKSKNCNEEKYAHFCYVNTLPKNLNIQ